MAGLGVQVAGLTSRPLGLGLVVAGTLTAVGQLLVYGMGRIPFTWFVDRWERLQLALRPLVFAASVGSGAVLTYVLIDDSITPATRAWLWILFGALVAVGLFRDVFGHRWTGPTERDRHAARRLLRALSEALTPAAMVGCVGPGQKLLRAYVMVPASGSQLRVWADWGMEGDADRTLTLFDSTGLPGWLYSAAVPEDMEVLDASEQASPERLLRGFTRPLPPDEAAKKRPMRTELCCRILDPLDARARTNLGTILGILCIDSDAGVDDMKLESDTAVSLIQGAADLLSWMVPRPVGEKQ